MVGTTSEPNANGIIDDIKRIPMTIKTKNTEHVFGLIRKGFEESIDPMGKPWKKLRLSKRPRPLLHTKKLYWNIMMDKKSGRIWVRNTPWAVVHQLGATIKPKNKPYLRFKSRESGKWYTFNKVKIPSRQFFPMASGQHKLPIRWWDSLKKATYASIEKIIGKLR